MFDHNDLKTLESSTFGKLPSLLDLDLSHNKLERVRRGVLAGLSSIRDVRLNNNEMKVIPTPPISLTHMHLSHNRISSIKGTNNKRASIKYARIREREGGQEKVYVLREVA